MKQKSRKSFTLVEMLIVIVIIGILAAALIPRLTSIQGRARDTQRRVDIRNIATAAAIYKQDKGAFPTGTRLTTDFDANGPIPLAPTYLTSVPRDSMTSSYSLGMDVTKVPNDDIDLTSTSGAYGYMTFPTSFSDQLGSMILLSRVETPEMGNWITNFTDGSLIANVPYGMSNGYTYRTGAWGMTNGYMGFAIIDAQSLSNALCQKFVVSSSVYYSYIVGSNIPGSYQGSELAPDPSHTCYVSSNKKTDIKYLYIQQ